MKIFDRSFFIGIALCGFGVYAMSFGLLLLISGSLNILVGGVSTSFGSILLRYGGKLAKSELPRGSETAIKILRKAKLVNPKTKR